MTDIVNDILKAASKNLLPGEKPVVLSTISTIATVVAAQAGKAFEFINSLGGAFKNATGVRVPDSFFKNLNQTEIRIHSVIMNNDVRIKTNPNVTSSINSMDVFDKTGKNLPVKNLTAPVQFEMDHKAKNPKCHYWCTTSNRWVNTGVQTIKTANDKVLCSTNHFTDFTVLNAVDEFTGSGNGVDTTGGGGGATGGGGGTTGGGGGTTGGGTQESGNRSAGTLGLGMNAFIGIGAVVGVIGLLVGIVILRRSRNNSLASRFSNNQETSDSTAAVMEMGSYNPVHNAFIENPLNAHYKK